MIKWISPIFFNLRKEEYTMKNIVDDIIGIKSEIKEIERVMKNCKDIKRHCETVAAAAKKLRRLQG